MKFANGSLKISAKELQNNFSIADYMVFAVFLLTSALIGVFFAWKGRKATSNKEFLTGNRNLQMFPVVMSLAASFMSTNTILGVPAEVYMLGTQFSVNIISVTVAIIISANIFMPVFYQLNMTSVNEYLMLRFKSKAARLIGSWAFLMCTLPYMAVVLYGPSLALNSVTPLSLEKSILVVGIICTFYTSIGGIKAVIWTDVLQCILMILGLLMVAIYGSIEAGGLLEPFKIADSVGRLKLFDMTLDPYRNDTLVAVISGTMISWCGMYCISQTEVQRFCSTRSESHAKKTLYWNIIPVTGIALTAVWCGIVLTAKYYDCDPVSMGIIKRTDQLMPYYVMETMSSVPGVAGLFTACIFSGALSTLSSGFNSLAAVTWDDMLKGYFTEKSGKFTANLTKGIAASYGIISIAMAFLVGRLGTVLQASIAISGAIRGPLFALFCLAFFFPFVNSKGGVSGTIIGISVSMVMAIGTIINPRPKFQLPVSVDACSNSTFDTYGYRNVSSNYMLPWDYEPQGFNKFLHMSYFFVSVVGFSITIISGVMIALATGGLNEDVDESLMSKYHLPSKKRPADDTNGKKKRKNNNMISKIEIKHVMDGMNQPNGHEGPDIHPPNYMSTSNNTHKRIQQLTTCI